METDCSWAEDGFVCKGNLVHENVDAGKCGSARNAIVERSVKVYNDDWGLFGVIDCLELRRSPSGSFIEKYGERFELTIVEYKVRSPKTGDFRHEDGMQLLAQKICADGISHFSAGRSARRLTLQTPCCRFCTRYAPMILHSPWNASASTRISACFIRCVPGGPLSRATLWRSFAHWSSVW